MAIQANYALVKRSFNSFRQLWKVYEVQCRLLTLYLALSPKERWLHRVAPLVLDCLTSWDAFVKKDKFAGVYAWLSLETGMFYVGSSVDFKQRTYNHVLSVRRSPKQRVHSSIKRFGYSTFIPVPLFACPPNVLRQVERDCIGLLKPPLNREWVPVRTKSKRAFKGCGKGRRVMKQRPSSSVPAGKRPPSSVCSVKLGSQHFPSLQSALSYAKAARLSSFSLQLNKGLVHVGTVSDVRSMFGKSIVQLDGGARCRLSDLWSQLSGAWPTSRCLQVHNLVACGWKLWVADTLKQVVLMPCSVKQWYKLDQRSFVRLYKVALQWPVAKERQQVVQLVTKVCRSVHKVSLSWVPTIKVPLGLEGIHPQLRHWLSSTIVSSSRAAPCILRFWLERARVVQMQGRTVGQLLGNFRQVCRSVDCSPEADNTAVTYAGRMRLPMGDQYVQFRGDDASLQADIREVTGLHLQYIPYMSDTGVSQNTVDLLTDQLSSLHTRLGIKGESREALASWIAFIASDCKFPAAVPGSVPLVAVQAVRRQLKGLVGVPIDKNRILYFEDVAAYRQRLINTFIQDTVHYQQVQDSEGVVIAKCLLDFDRNGWARFAKFKPNGRLGFAQCLPKDKDCSLSRPIVPNCGHPMASLYNMAARGWAFVLKNIRMTHYNLFTTQQFVAELAALSPVVADMLDTGVAGSATIAQSDVKDMYTEISHADIDRCISVVFDAWVQSGRATVLNITRSGRCGVCVGRSRDHRLAVSMPLQVVRDIMLYELQHAFFRVGRAHVLRQAIGVSMGSAAGPVLAWNVCMVHEAAFHRSLGVDERFIRVFRYFDDVWQLLLVPRGADSSWVERAVDALRRNCYPTSLRLILNSVGDSAEMLSCLTGVKGVVLSCRHRCKNVHYWLTTGKPRFANFLPFASAHARRTRVMKNTVLGLLHRIHMDTLPGDVAMLLPVLVGYNLDLIHAGYPLGFFYKVFQAFMKHPKVADSRRWWLLFTEYSLVFKSLWVLTGGSSNSSHPVVVTQRCLFWLLCSLISLGSR